jgi:hypothetical protein
MKLLSSFYSNDNVRIAEVHQYDEDTFVVLFQDGQAPVTRTYFSVLQRAENAAEDFVERA